MGTNIFLKLAFWGMGPFGPNQISESSKHMRFKYNVDLDKAGGNSVYKSYWSCPNLIYIIYM